MFGRRGRSLKRGAIYAARILIVAARPRSTVCRIAVSDRRSRFCGKASTTFWQSDAVRRLLCLTVTTDLWFVSMYSLGNTAACGIKSSLYASIARVLCIKRGDSRGCSHESAAMGLSCNAFHSSLYMSVRARKGKQHESVQI